jgi:hypothetical protein
LRRPELARHTGNPQRGTGGAGKIACEEQQRASSRPGPANGSATGIRMGRPRVSQAQHRTSTRCKPARPARTACEDDTDLPCVRTCPSTFTSARVRQPETEEGRQAVPRAER